MATLSPSDPSLSDIKAHGAVGGAASLECCSETREHFKNVMIDRMVDPGLHILIVEDVAFTRKVLHDLLLGNGAVDAVGCAKEGWDAYLKKAHDIIFIDIGLEDMPGHVLAARIREINPNAYIVMATGQNTVDEVQKAIANHTNGYVLKPFNKKKVQACVENYLLKHKPQGVSEIQIERR